MVVINQGPPKLHSSSIKLVKGGRLALLIRVIFIRVVLIKLIMAAQSSI